jgi:hypothetical protein
MAAYILFDATDGTESKLEYVLPGSEAEVFVEIVMQFSAADLLAWYGDSSFRTPRFIEAGDGGPGAVFVTDDGSTGAYNAWWESFAATKIAGHVAPDTWHTVQYLYNTPRSAMQLQVDGDAATYSAAFATSPVTEIMVGLCSPFTPTGQLKVQSIKVGTSFGASDLISFDATTATDLSPFTLFGTVTLAGSPPPPPTPSRRFFSGYPWRFIVTDLNTQTITFLDRLATARQVTVARNAARHAQGTVPSDNPEINIQHTDGDPFLAEGNRLIYGFRREGWNGTVAPWVCRFSGPLLHLEDNAQTDAPVSPWIAMDPWALLYKRPVRLEDGSLPGPDGRVFLAGDLWTYQEIAYQLLLDSITYDGTCFIDPTGGTIVAGTVIPEDFTLQQGLSVGAAWDQLCATGQTDIELDPVYDPVGSPGVCCTFNAKPVIGTVQNAAIFAWDLPSRSLADVSRVTDGTGRENTIQYYLGQGGPPVTQAVDAVSVAKYGEYWAQQFWPGFKQAGPVTAMAARRLALVKDGMQTFTFAPAPERAPIPFDDYMVGDWAPFFASKKLRAPLGPTLASGVWTNIPRIEAFTLDIADNQTETVSQLLTALDIQPA